jgi:opacity protein-like surface antigen
MKATRIPLIVSALTALLALPSGLRAQDELGVALLGGLTYASGDASEDFGSGPNFGIKTMIPISERLAVQATIGYQELRVRQDEALLDRGYDPSTFRLGGGFMEGGNRHALGVLASGQFHLLPRSARISPYVLAGAGLAQVRLSDVGIFFLGEWDDEPGTSEIALAADVGAGVQFRVSNVVSFFAQGSYQTLFTDGTSTNMVPAQIGILLELGN